MSAAQFPEINGIRYSWASVEIKLDGQVYTGLKSINYKQSLKSTKVMGAGVMPQGRTKGAYEASGDMEMFLQDMSAFRDALAAKGPSYALVEFDIIVHYSEGPSAPVIEHKLAQCRIEDEDNSNSQGADPTVEKVALSIMWIEKNGKRMVAPEDNGGI